MLRLFWMVFLIPWLADAAPAVVSFMPTNGPVGTQVTVQGSGFSGATLVQFNNTPADFQVQSGSQLLATVPPEATVGPIRVSDAGGIGNSGTKHFLPEPRLAAFSPARGAVQTTVVLEGQNFAAVTGVRFGALPSVFSLPTSTQIRATVPSGLSNSASVYLTVETAAGRVTSSNRFVVIGPAPVVDGFAPESGSPGTTVDIEGANFERLTAVRFGGVAAQTFNAPSPARITAVVPPGGATGPITVVTSAGSVNTTNVFRVSLAPGITNFSPRIGKAGQTQVTIEGINFEGFQGVGFNGVRGTGFGNPSPGRLLGTVPQGATTGRITVTNQHGVGVSDADFVIPVAPLIESFDPQIGRPGDPVTITGYNLNGAVFRFNQTQASYVHVGQSGTSEVIRANVPGGSSTGPLSSSNSAGVFVTTDDFTVIGGAPFILSATPDHGPRGSPVTVAGRNFIPPVAVFFNGVQDTSAFASSPSQIHATVPGAATTGPLVVGTVSGRATNAVPFHLPPRITSMSPSSAPVGGQVMFNGANLGYATRVEFGGVAAAFVTNATTGTLAATVPANALTGLVRITNPGGVVLSSSAFTVLPEILSLDPTLGPIGSAVTIHGTSFEGASSVTFNNRVAIFTVVSSTEITASVPGNSTTGRVRVTTPGGTATSPADFRVTTSTDLRLIGTASASLLMPGEEVTFSYAITNRGLSPGTGVRLEQRLPAGLAHVSAELSQGFATFADGVLLCELGVVSNAAAATVAATAQAVTEGVWTNVVNLTLAEGDQNVGDNTVRIGLIVASQASRTLQLLTTPIAQSVVLVWPVSPVPLRPEFVDFLSASNVWQVVGGSPQISSGMYRLTNAVPGISRIYRLALP